MATKRLIHKAASSIDDIFEEASEALVKSRALNIPKEPLEAAVKMVAEEAPYIVGAAKKYVPGGLRGHSPIKAATFNKAKLLGREELRGARKINEVASQLQSKYADISEAKSLKKMGSLKEYSETRASNQVASANLGRAEALDAYSKGTLTPRQLKKLGITDEMNREVGQARINKMYVDSINGVSNEAAMGDYMGYYRMPQKAAAVGGTAWLVSRMSETRGQLSNNELYGQSPPYGR